MVGCDVRGFDASRSTATIASLRWLFLSKHFVGAIPSFFTNAAECLPAARAAFCFAVLDFFLPMISTASRQRGKSCQATGRKCRKVTWKVNGMQHASYDGQTKRGTGDGHRLGHAPYKYCTEVSHREVKPTLEHRQETYLFIRHTLDRTLIVHSNR
jgi:hypothetical protein